jgi:hypothetical protein
MFGRAVDDEDFNRTFNGFQLQTKLLLNGGEYEGLELSADGCGGTPGATVPRPGSGVHSNLKSQRPFSSVLSMTGRLSTLCSESRCATCATGIAVPSIYLLPDLVSSIRVAGDRVPAA